MTGTGINTQHKTDWDASVERIDGDLLQHWNWGEFKSRYGWTVERVCSSDGSLAQILFRHLGPVSIGYIPRGPVFTDDTFDHLEFLHDIDEACARHRAISLIVEPSQPLPDAWHDHGHGLVPSSRAIQSPRTVMVDLALDDDALLQQMRKDTRYNISYARRHGMEIERAPVSDKSLDQFFSLLSDSAKRGEFGIHDRSYYADFMELFGDRAVLLFARMNGAITAGLIACRYGSSARSMYAGMRPHPKSRGDAALLRFAAMQWAREHGCAAYDLGGIAPIDPVSLDGSAAHPRADAVAGLIGVEKFKTGFGGEIVTFPQTMERVYHPRLTRIARSFQKWTPRNPD